MFAQRGWSEGVDIPGFSFILTIEVVGGSGGEVPARRSSSAFDFPEPNYM